MKYTQNLNMKIPEGGDPIDIADITGNFETLDEEVNKKASSSGGDISNTTIKTVDEVATEFPVPSAGESLKTFLGKVRKFIQDFNDFKSGILTLGRLVNNGQTTATGFALDARYGKTLYDLYTKVVADLGIIAYGTELTRQITSSWTNNASIALTPGFYIIEGQVSISVAATGVAIKLVELGEFARQSVYAPNSDTHTAHVTATFAITQNSTVYLQSWSARQFTANEFVIKVTRLK